MPRLLALEWDACEARIAVARTRGNEIVVEHAFVVDFELGEGQTPAESDVGKRLALWALAKDYGKTDLVYSGPLYKSMKIEGDSIRLSFDHVGGGLVSRDKKSLSLFTIAGKDGKFIPAKAVIDGDTVIVSSDDVKVPRNVRFGWDQLAEPNLSNKAGLPASPFRTDRGK